jgi:murein DD-endopeptidase MepM/ murein hydrolase activator NlpD
MIHTLRVVRLAVLGVAFAALSTSCGDDGVFKVGNTNYSAEEEFLIEIDAAGLTTLDLKGINGTIDVTGVAGADTIRISGVRRVESESVADAQENLAKLTVDETIDGSKVSITTLQPEKTEGRNYVVNYTVALPVDIVTLLANVNGALTIQSMQNTMTLSNVNGSISASDVFAGMTVAQTNGPIDVSATLPMGESIKIAAVNGNIDLAIPQTTSADLAATANAGSITTENLVLTNEVRTSTTLTGTVGKGNGSITLTSVTGNIRIVGTGPVDYTAAFPLYGYQVIQQFAHVNSAFDDRHHAAEDAFGAAGTPVYAMADGVISYSGPALGYGWLITIDHPQLGVYSLYGHLSTRRSKIVEGAVKKGDVIASLADDDEDGSGGGYPNWGPHLHFGIRQGAREDYPSSDDDDRWMAGYTCAHPETLGWLRPSVFILSHQD